MLRERNSHRPIPLCAKRRNKGMLRTLRNTKWLSFDQITIQEAESHIAGVLQDVLGGEEIIITDHDKPVAKFIPYNPQNPKRGLFGSAKGMISYIAEDFDETPEEFKDYM
jgi:antitoxin (DNA-binding transcriptional repressor) of toxin-antitoxin stability system